MPVLETDRGRHCLARIVSITWNLFWVIVHDRHDRLTVVTEAMDKGQNSKWRPAGL